MLRENIVKRVMAIIFVITLYIGFIKSGSYLQIQRLAEYLMQDIDSLDTLESEFSSIIWHHQDFIDLNGAMARILNMQGFYSDMGMYITDDMYIVSASDYTSTDYEFDEIIDFNAFLKENEIQLLYVNEPTKYIDDNLFSKEFGVETFSNRNADVFIARIREAGINTIDLRANIQEENLNIFDLFYRTDHHWTTRAGLWASQIIAGGLNEYCGYNIDTSIYDESNYTFMDWSECWLGEQGRKIAETYVGLDNYTTIKPNFPTYYTFKSDDGNYDNTFEYFINESVYNLENNVYENSSWHYSYRQINCINNNIEMGKILILGDSYEQVTEPFISLGVHEVDSLILRRQDDSFSLRNYILENGYDTVVICYAQFMIGAHDDPSSANYRMFCFEY